MRPLLLAAALLLLAQPARAVPPPPPNPENLVSLQAFIAGMQTHDVARYASALADDVTVTDAQRQVAADKPAWLRLAAERFAGADRSLAVERIAYSYDKALVIERIPRVLDACCIYTRTEELTFRRGKIVRIDRSSEYINGLLLPDGGRADIP